MWDGDIRSILEVSVDFSGVKMGYPGTREGKV